MIKPHVHNLIITLIMLGAYLVVPSITTTPVYATEKTTQTETRQEMVFFNTESHKYHQPTCSWAKRCTKNCIKIPRSEAIQKGGIPCKVCGG